ncbi:MAG: TetR/AcrR family transcriptional regulator [Thermoplasmata archaeon]|nr:TetR/AcrR family transcriptional regulator [Thermoplasmata archaeon]
MTPESGMKERIFESAFELFSSRGYDKVSLSEIIEKAGVSKGGLFHYFDSKYALGRDCLMWWAQTHMEPAFSEELMKEMDGKDLLTHFIDSMMDLIENETIFTRFFWSIFDEAMRRKEDTGIWMEFLNSYVSMVENIYREMGVKDPRMKAMLLLSNMDGIALYYAMLKESGTEMDIGALKAELIRTYVTFDEEARK